MIPIPTLFFGARDRRRRRWPTGFWFGAVLVLVAAGGSFGEVAGGGDEASLSAAVLPPDTSSEPAKTSETLVTSDAIVEHEAVHAGTASARPGDEQQRRVFMLLLLNSAGPLHPYRGLSR